MLRSPSPLRVSRAEGDGNAPLYSHSCENLRVRHAFRLGRLDDCDTQEGYEKCTSRHVKSNAAAVPRATARRRCESEPAACWADTRPLLAANESLKPACVRRFLRRWTKMGDAMLRV